MELHFEIRQTRPELWEGICLETSIAASGATVDACLANLKDAVDSYFDGVITLLQDGTNQRVQPTPVKYYRLRLLRWYFLSWLQNKVDGDKPQHRQPASGILALKEARLVPTYG